MEYFEDNALDKGYYGNKLLTPSTKEDPDAWWIKYKKDSPHKKQYDILKTSRKFPRKSPMKSLRKSPRKSSARPSSPTLIVSTSCSSCACWISHRRRTRWRRSSPRKSRRPRRKKPPKNPPGRKKAPKPPVRGRSRGSIGRFSDYPRPLLSQGVFCNCRTID